MVVSPIVASSGDAGSVGGFGVDTTGAGVAVGDGLGAAGLEVPGRRGDCAATAMNKKAVANSAGIILRRFIKRPSRPGHARLRRAIVPCMPGACLPLARHRRADRAKIIFEEPSTAKRTTECNEAGAHWDRLYQLPASWRTVSSVSISSAFLSGRRRTMRGKRNA